MRSVEVTPSAVIATVAVFVVAAVCIRLGFWQLDRRGQKLERNRVVAERMEGEPVILTAPPADTTGLGYRRAVVEGAYDADRSVVMAGRSLHGNPGVHVYSPVLLDGGAVLVNRGWMPAHDAATIDLAPLRVDSTVRVTGVLIPFPDVDIDPASRPAAFRTTWFRLDGVGIRGQYPYPVAPLYVQALPSGATAGEAPVPIGAPTVDAGPHMSYAIQWFSFAIIFLGGWLVIAVKGLGPSGLGGRADARRPGLRPGGAGSAGENK